MTNLAAMSLLASAASAAPGPVSPLNPSGPVSTTSPAFEWSAESTATYYLLQIADWSGTTVDSWFTPTAAGCASGSGTCSAVPNVSIAPGPASWKILAWNPSGYGPWSATRPFLIDTADPQAQAPQPLSPAGTLWSHHPVYSWSRVADAVLYRLSVSMNGQPASEWWFTPANLACVAAGATCSMGLTVAENGAADWRVQAWTASGRGAWSEVLTVQFGVFPAPAAPSGIAPVGPAGFSPALTWTAPANVTYYHLRVDDTTGSRVEQWITPAQAACANGGTCTFTPAVVLTPGEATWKVLAWNPTGYSPWSPALAFTVEAGGSGPSVPGRVTTVAPAAAVATGVPAFTWNAQPAATYYLVRVIDWTGSPAERWFSPAAAGCASGTGVCTGVLTVPIAPGPATWRALAWSPAGYAPWSEIRQFTVEVPDPSAPAPAVIGPSGPLWSHTATYSWSPVAGAVLYRLAVGTNGGPPSYAWFTPTELGCAAGSTPCGRGVTVAANGTAEWRVQAWTVAGYGEWSPLSTVTFAVHPAPQAPAALSPDASTGPSPAFTWTASANVVFYYMRADDSAGRRVDVWVTPVQAGCSSGSGTCTFTPGAVLGPGAAHWKVLAWNPSGYSKWSAIRSFTVTP
jgi:hypothetical protein